MHAAEPTIAVAAIVHGGKGRADGPLLEFVARLRSQGRVVRGLVPEPQHNAAARAIRDLEHDTLYPIRPSLGTGSKACCLDPDALLRAGIVLRRAIEADADLVIVNRFGTLEADGGGFRAEMLELMTRGRPMLTVVSPPYLAAWREFTGDMATELSPDADEILQWFNGVAAAGAGGAPSAS